MNAVFERDFVAFSASARFQWLRFAFAGVMGAVLLACVVPAHARNSFTNVGATVFGLSTLVGFGVVAIAVPGSFATVLVHARAGSTLPVLLTTPLSPLAIAAGAFLARIATFLVLVLATWPPIALSLSYGGIRATNLFAATATIVATGLLVAAPSFVCSAYSRRTTSAVVTSYLVSASLLFGLYVAAPGSPAGGIWDGVALSPIHAFVATSDTTMLPPPGAASAPYLLLAWTAGAAATAILLVAWRIAREGRGTADEARTASLGGRVCRAQRYENPVLDREVRSAGILRRGATGRGLLVFLILSECVFAGLAAAWKEPTNLLLHFGVLTVQGFFLVLAVTAAGATALAAEREGRTLDLVRCSPLTAREIVVGKLVGVFRGFAPCLVVPAIHLAIGAALGVFHWAAIPLMAVTGSVALGTWATFGLSQSLDQPNPNRAVTRTMSAFAIVGVLIAANVGIPLAGALSNSDRWVRWTAAFGANPVALTFLPAAALRVGGSDETNTALGPTSTEDRAAALVAGAAWVGLYTLLGLAVYRRLFTTYRSRVDG